jgi:hypothetical protein
VGSGALDGPAVARAYQATPGPHAPLLLLTATDPPAGPVAGVLPKPVDPGAVRALVRRHPGAPAGGAASAGGDQGRADGP